MEYPLLRRSCPSTLTNHIEVFEELTYGGRGMPDELLFPWISILGKGMQEEWDCNAAQSHEVIGLSK